MEDCRSEFAECRRFLDGLTGRPVVVMGNRDARNVSYRHFEDFLGARDSVTTVATRRSVAPNTTADRRRSAEREASVTLAPRGWLVSLSTIEGLLPSSADARPVAVTRSVSEPLVEAASAPPGRFPT
jgi:hypothetical protein